MTNFHSSLWMNKIPLYLNATFFNPFISCKASWLFP
jgi:hypothetical protein